MIAKQEFLNEIRNKSKVLCSIITHYKKGIKHLHHLTTGWTARIKTDSIISAEDKYILNAIDNCIKKACDEGQYHIWYNEKLSDIVLTDLK